MSNDRDGPAEEAASALAVEAVRAGLAARTRRGTGDPIASFVNCRAELVQDMLGASGEGREADIEKHG